MGKKHKANVSVAICYDFDGTLSPGNMQEYDYFTALGNSSRNFWEDARDTARANGADPILTYMMLMIERARNCKVRTTLDKIAAESKLLQYQ